MNEHGLYLFYGDKLFFGLLWGVLGAVLILADNGVANVVFAMVLAFIVQMRIDHLNHAIAAVIVILAFAIAASVHTPTFVVFFTSFVIFGGLRAYIGDVRGRYDLLYRFSEPGWAHYYIVPFAWSLYSGAWILFGFTATYRTAYNAAKYGLYLKGYYSKL